MSGSDFVELLCCTGFAEWEGVPRTAEATRGNGAEDMKASGFSQIREVTIEPTRALSFSLLCLYCCKAGTSSQFQVVGYCVKHAGLAMGLVDQYAVVILKATTCMVMLTQYYKFVAFVASHWLQNDAWCP